MLVISNLVTKVLQIFSTKIQTSFDCELIRQRYGAIHYTKLYSNNFNYEASFSGTIDLLDTRIHDVIVEIARTNKTTL